MAEKVNYIYHPRMAYWYPSWEGQFWWGYIMLANFTALCMAENGLFLQPKDGCKYKTFFWVFYFPLNLWKSVAQYAYGIPLNESLLGKKTNFNTLQSCRRVGNTRDEGEGSQLIASFLTPLAPTYVHQVLSSLLLEMKATIAPTFLFELLLIVVFITLCTWRSHGRFWGWPSI